jgi:NNP family nitrate/nitrite transporter-like MFS transporter
VPNLIGAALRIPYTFAVPRFGGRAWTTVSALPLVIKNTFPEFLAQHSFIATYLAGLAFMGALIGSISRPFGGWLADRLGGARVTLAVFIGMVAATLAAIAGINAHSFALFFGAYMVVFALSGMGNGSTYRMIPSIFARLGVEHAREHGGDPIKVTNEFKRRAAAVIGIAGAIGAFGGFLIQVVLRQSSLEVSGLMKAATTPAEKKAIALANTDWSVPALWTFIVAYLVFAGLTWLFYIRQTAEHEGTLPVAPLPASAEGEAKNARELAGVA